MAIEQAFEQLSKAILNFVNFGITILVLLLIWEGIRFIAGPKGETAKATGARLTDWKKSPVLNMIKKERSRYRTRLLNDYLQEQKETQFLDGAVKAAQKALVAVEKARSDKEFKTEGERDEMVKAVEEVEEHLKAVKHRYRRVNKATWRQEREMGPLLEKMRKEGKDVNDLITLENNILRLHKECITEADKVIGHYDTLKTNLTAIKHLTGFPTTIADSVLKDMQDNLQDEVYELEAIYKKQVEADKEVQGIISKVRPLWS